MVFLVLPLLDTSKRVEDVGKWDGPDDDPCFFLWTPQLTLGVVQGAAVGAMVGFGTWWLEGGGVGGL